jgi:hypothetical protein
MASDTRNVKVGVCKVFFGGVDLGYTKGGVEVEVSTETYKVEVDQFGKSPISETIMARSVKAKVPMAETTIENMVRIMPGASLVQAGGVKATGTITITTNPANNNTIVINGVTFTFRTGTAPLPNDVLIGADANATAANLRAKLQASYEVEIATAEYTVLAAVVTVTYNDFGTAGNAFTLVTGTAAAAVTMSGATLTGGTEPTSKRVDVTDAVGTNLLNIAQELRLHPQEKPEDDLSDDFVIPLAATAGQVTFAYKLEEERIFNCEFMGYPNPQTRRLYFVGKE